MATNKPHPPARAGQRANARNRVLELPETITVRELAETVGASPIEVIKFLMRRGVMAAINQTVDFDTAAMVASALGYEVRRQQEEAPAGPPSVKQLLQEEDASALRPRPPVVTVLGHVDHGKTTLLDAIRHTRVAEEEVGGITQHIGAYQVDYNGQRITFLDTPGHEAFTSLRARGARVTDIAVLVVAADDGVMPQTEEALAHAKAAEVPIIVAINKIDKPGADPERVKRQLAERGLLPEEWGGDTIMVPVSAKLRQGIDDLLENILLLAEILELRANPNRPALGTVIEARLDKSRGPVATVLVQNGTLRVGDNVVVGDTWGRVKALFNFAGQRIKEAGPSTPVELLGLEELPQAGDILTAVATEREAREVAEQRRQQREAERLRPRAISLEEVSARAKSGEVRELPIIIKCDVQGSVEAVRNAVEHLGSDKVRIHILHAAPGTITVNDVLLAVASRAVVIGFNTRVEPGARNLAEQEKVSIRLYNVIYHLVEDLQRAVQGLLAPEAREVEEGRAEVRAVFSVGKRGRVAGCLVVDGRLSRGARVRVLRKGKVVHEGAISSLRHYKEDVREVPAGSECGVGIEGFTDFQEGDLLVAYRLETPRA